MNSSMARDAWYPFFFSCDNLGHFAMGVDVMLGLSDSNIEDLSVHPFCFDGKLSIDCDDNGVAPCMGPVGAVFVSAS